jgi:hypothetical protein
LVVPAAATLGGYFGWVLHSSREPHGPTLTVAPTGRGGVLVVAF